MIRVPTYKARIPISGGGGHIDLREPAGPNPIVQALQEISERQRQRGQDELSRRLTKARIKQLKQPMGQIVVGDGKTYLVDKQTGKKIDLGIPASTSIEESVSQSIPGYGKPSGISIGPTGRPTGATYRREKGAEYPEEYKADITNAISAINRGADPLKVYRRIVGKYPQLSTELKSILLYTPASSRLDSMKEALFGNE